MVYLMVFNSSDHIALNDRENNDMESTQVVMGIDKVATQHLPGRTEESHKNRSKNSQSLG
jgi:hypothetical protein